MVKKNANALFALLLAVSFTAAMLSGQGCTSDGARPAQNGTVESQEIAIDIGQGSTVFIFESVNAAGETSVWNVHTDEETVGAALLEAGLIEGDDGDWGLMVMVVNGIRADYTEDGAYWAFFVDGDYAATGADMTEIKQGSVYAFVYTPA